MELNVDKTHNITALCEIQQHLYNVGINVCGLVTGEMTQWLRELALQT